MYWSTYTNSGKWQKMEIVKQIAESKAILFIGGTASVGGGTVINNVKKAAVEPTWLDSVASNAVAIGAICISIQALLAVLRFGMDIYFKRKERKKAERERTNQGNISPKK